MQKHILIIGNRAVGNTTKVKELVNGQHYKIYHQFNFFNIKTDMINEPYKVLVFDELSVKKFLSEDVMYFCTLDILRCRSRYDEQMKEVPMPQLIFVVTCKRNQLPEDMRRFDIIDLNVKIVNLIQKPLK